MIEAGEVGAVFTIVDKASAVLKLIADQLKAIQAQIDRVTVAFDSLSIGMGAKFDKAAIAIDSAMSRAADGAIADLARIDAAAAATAANVGRIGRGGGMLAARGSGGGEGGGRSGFSSVHVPLPGGRGGVHIPGGPLLAGAAVAAYGTKLAADMQDAIFQLEYHTGMADTPANSERFRSIIQGAMAKTGSTLDAVIAASKQEARMFRGTPGNGIDVLPEMLAAAATEARVKGATLEESMTSFIGLAHMLKEYSPDEIKKLAPAFGFLSASNPSSLAGIERAASYAVPILQSEMDVDPIQTLLLGTVLTRAGATNTKSGTWLRNMALAAMPGTSAMTKTAFEKHEHALRELGLIDEKNQPTWFTDGKPDLIKMLDVASHRADGISLLEKAGIEQQLFKKQGSGAFALLAEPAVQAQLAALDKGLHDPETKSRYANFMADYSGASTVQKSRQTWADAQNALTDLGTTTLPAATAALTFFDGALKNLVAIPGIIKALANTPNPFGPNNGNTHQPLSGPTTGPASIVSPNTAGLGPVSLAPASVTGMGAAMTAAAAAIKPPQVKNDTKVDVKVTIDGAAIAAQIEKHITQNTRVINGTSGFDTGAGVMPTDGGFVGP